MPEIKDIHLKNMSNLDLRKADISDLKIFMWITM